ncbi:hypothetical protein ACFOZ1_14875 [Gracilibacillus marinus]|jgi:hypothetical protein|uniref:Uncharacterized protein n=1 Tax=Gracilibacillus marinus TaxID=630535 RepID=A0ABV8VY30_9BACI
MIFNGTIINVSNQSLEYKEEELIVSGEITYNVAGLSKEELSNHKSYIKAIQFIGDDNVEYLLKLK